MTDWLFQFGSAWVLILAALVLIIALVLVILSTVVRRAGNEGPDHALVPAAAPAAAGGPAEAAVPEPTGPTESASSSFARAMRFLRSTVGGRDYRYQIPWYLVIGDPGSGKSALMRGVGVNLSASDNGSRSPLEWRFLDRGILIAVAGRYFKGGSARDQHGWKGLLRLLQNHRPRRPLDGIVLTVSASDLIGPSALDESQLSARAARFGELLAQAQRTLGFIFPVYVMVTRCDEIAGFGAFCRELPQKNRDDIFGWSSPYQLDASFGPEWVEEAFNSISLDLQRLQSEILVERSELRDPDAVFLFPEDFAALRSPMGTFLERLFRETAYREAFRFRGLYFSGDAAEYAAPEPQPEADETPLFEQFLTEIAPPPPRQPAFQARRSPVFVKRLFEEKIFAENALARPLARVFLTKSRTVAYGQAAAALLAVVLLAGTWFSYRRLAGDRDRLLPALDKMTLSIPKSEGPAEKKAFGLGLLKSLNNAATVQFWSPFQPASWFAPTDESVTLVMKTACEQWVFSAIQADLLQRKTALLYPQPEQPQDSGPNPAEAREEDTSTVEPASKITGLESTGEYQGLADFVNQLQSLGEAISTYESLRQQNQSATPDRIRKLLTYLDLLDVQPTGHLGVALVQASGPPAVITPADIATASDTIQQQIGDVLRDWFENNAAWGDVKRLRNSVSDLQRGRLARYDNAISNLQRVGGTTYDRLTDLLNLIGRVQNDFADPNFRWLSNTSMELPGALQRVSVNPLAGPKAADVAAYARLQGEGYFNRLRNNLRDERTALTNGPLVDLNKNPIDLSDKTKQLQIALQNTLGLPFIGDISPREIQIKPDANQRLIWRADPLHEAQRLFSFYTQFVQDGLRNAPETLSASLSHLAFAQLASHVQDLIAQAQTFQVRSAALTGSIADDDTLEEVNAFRDAAGPLEQLAGQFNGQDHIHNAVRQVTVLQAYNLLSTLDTRLRSEQPYAIKPGAWSGSGSLSFAVFGVNSLPALNVQLGVQRERVQFFEKQAEPLVPFLTRYMPVQASAQVQLIAKWKGIIDDFQQYANKGTASTLASLEDFVVNGIDKLPAAACKTGAAEAGTDYFGQIHNNLENQLANRCRDVTASTVCGAYGAIAAQFSEKLANRFPFTPAASPVTGGEAIAKDVTAFYQMVDAKGKPAHDALKASLDDTARFGNDGKRARQFLDQMDDLRLVALPASPETEKEPAFTVDIVPQFRVNRTNESGGNQIIEWGMQVGGQIFQQKDPEHPGRWRTGNPVRLSLRWANDSVYVPVADSSQPDLVIRERNAYFEFTNQWALLAFLRGHEAPSSDLGQSADPLPYTLKFRVKTAGDPKWAASSGKPATSSATVFLHLKITQAGKKDPINIPPFPAAAPQLVTGCGQF